MNRSRVFVGIGIVSLAMVVSSLGSDKVPKLSADAIVAKHLDAIGSPDARAAAKSRTAQGTVHFSERITGAVHLDGSASLISEGSKVKYAFKFGAPQYPGEQLAYDGRNVGVGLIDQQSRSRLGNFVVQEPEILSEGIFGGVLGMGWPLLNREASGVKLKGEGVKKVEGRNLYALSYTPKKRNGSGELSVVLFFDPETFHHVLTVYRLASTPVDQGETTDPGGVTTIVEERFEDFRAVYGITLPATWDIRVRVEPGKAVEYEWKVALTNVAHNKL
jgi:hypothetical protein